MGGNANALIADVFLANLVLKYMDKLVSSMSPDNLRMPKKLTLSRPSLYNHFVSPLPSPMQ